MSAADLGPGSYDVPGRKKPFRTAKNSVGFISGKERFEKSTVTFQPGPGAYPINGLAEQTIKQGKNGSFGSTERRFASFKQFGTPAPGQYAHSSSIRLLSQQNSSLEVLKKS